MQFIFLAQHQHEKGYTKYRLKINCKFSFACIDFVFYFFGVTRFYLKNSNQIIISQSPQLKQPKSGCNLIRAQEFRFFFFRFFFCSLTICRWFQLCEQNGNVTEKRFYLLTIHIALTWNNFFNKFEALFRCFSVFIF